MTFVSKGRGGRWGSANFCVWEVGSFGEMVRLLLSSLGMCLTPSLLRIIVSHGGQDMSVCLSVLDQPYISLQAFQCVI